MKTKEIYEKIEELVFKKYRTKTKFINKTDRSFQNFWRIVNRVVKKIKILELIIPIQF